MFNLGWPEVAIAVVVAIVIFGPQKLPELGRSLAKTFLGFKSEIQPGPTRKPDDDPA
ncbi:twin-arginine translocase TatA/TatE family subunit [Thermosynechococcaceae cyanobacterium BACA0444]|uniref:Twin-arginine translocase TatA/TatE family subunit n=1 Tax=Pseudocalidococcus azoricus BACA0444 TaxID=2918990 RepID=A0AAE4FNV8_9CYAN|nr:twin-arginine translocase TatA/TatE family subunit [Pseudocalidococcus azoricus]MDS3859426.1 twin-arginine translocase TatA/TatE family subunit [Pseudocalidococcus azoricus BACA0444]